MNIKALVMSKQVLLAVAMIALVATAGFLGTRAFFSDTETSNANVFAAGSLDLEIGIEGAGDDNNFAPQSIPGNQSLFIFNDLIPGDSETGYFRLESSQDAWACIASDITADYENTRLDAEETAGDNTSGTGVNGGELSQYMEIAIWEANNNNTDGVVGTNENDTLRVMSLQDFANGEYLALQDSATGDNPLLSGAEEQYEFAYCFGEFSNAADVTANGGTLECDGSSAGNDSQTDSTEMTIHFYAEQMQNNENFVCGDLNPAETQVAGANFSNYAAPTCNATVAGSQSIQGAVDSANTGDTICVLGGYNGTGDSGPIRLNVDDITLAGDTQGVDIFNPVVIDNDGVTVTGLEVTSGPVLGENAGVYVNNNVDGYEVSFNNILGAGVSARGVLTSTAGTSNGLIANNVLSGLATGIYSNNSDTTVVEYNDFSSNNVGLSHDAGTGNIIRYNEFSGNSFESIGYGGGVIVVSQNNILDGNVSNYTGSTLDAENNWWGANGAGDQTNEVSGSIDSDPEAISAFPQN